MGAALDLKCVAIKAVSVEYSWNNLHYSFLEPIIRQSPSNISTIVDRNLTLFCEADGFPVPSISWQKRENSTGRWHQITPSGRILTRRGSLVFKRLLASDTAYYRCSAENAKGSEYSAHAYLSVEGWCWSISMVLWCDVFDIRTVAIFDIWNSQCVLYKDWIQIWTLQWCAKVRSLFSSFAINFCNYFYNYFDLPRWFEKKTGKNGRK